MSTKIEIIKELKQSLQQHCNNNVQNVILFGSQVYNNANTNADYDILIILKNKYTYKDEDQIINLCYDIDMKHDIFIDVHLLSQNELNTEREQQPIYINAINNGIYA